MRSVSVVANGSAFEGALDLISNHREIGVGVHLCLVNERPLLPTRKMASLIDKEGFMPKSWFSFFLKIYNKEIVMDEVCSELDAQIRKVLDCGIVPTHLDGHQYAHLLPPVFKTVIALAKKYGIKSIRYPNDTSCFRRVSFNSVFKGAGILLLSGHQLSILHGQGISCADTSFGVMTSGRIDEPLIRKFLHCLKPGLSDITSHPGYTPKNNRYADSCYKWEQEMQVLKKQEIKALIKDLGITLTNYAK